MAIHKEKKTNMSKRILIINSVLGFGSTGNIVLNLAKEYEQNGYEAKVAYGRIFKFSEDKKADIEKYGVHIGSDMDVNFHVIYTRLTDRHGLASTRATKKFLEWADDYNPDILWLHNIHGYYINYELLFEWIKSRPDMQVKWTLHDCWAFTGHCSYFTFVGCDKWKYTSFNKESEYNNDCNGCHNCPQIDQYPKAKTDNSEENYIRKKRAFTGVQNLTIITPSNWLKEEVHKSFLFEYPIEVKYNTINTDIFKPTPSTFKQDLGIQDKKMILGVANIWEKRKGLDDFIQLSKLIGASDNADQYQIVLVGLNDTQIKEFASSKISILALPRTNSARELAQIYTAADVFVNPTYEDNYPTVNLEAEACGTPVITYDIGGCKETIYGINSLSIKPDVEKLYDVVNKCLKLQ